MTPINEKLFQKNPEPILREIPLHRTGGENDLKGIVVLLASDASSFMTGAIIPVDGGTVAFMSSILGSIGENTSGGYDLYRISKASLNMLARSFAAVSAKDRKITVLNLHPGWVRTDMGGPSAPLGVEDSVRGLVNVLETQHGAKHLYLDYRGREIPW